MNHIRVATGPEGLEPGDAWSPEARMGRVRDTGALKVTGALKYVDDLREDDVGFAFDYAYPVVSTIARGKVAGVDDTEALKVEGVLGVVWYKNAPRLRDVTAMSLVEIGQHLPLQEPTIYYHGECVALVLAATPDAARAGARRLVVHYGEESEGPGAFTLADGSKRLDYVKRAGIAPGRIEHGDAPGDYARSPVQVDTTCHHAPHHHNGIEITAYIAHWDDDGGVSVHAPVQWHHIDTLVLGQAFGLGLKSRLPGFVASAFLGRQPSKMVRLHNVPSGGAFGRNINAIPMILACMAAKLHDKGIKLILDRNHTYSLHSHRGEVRNRIRLGADEDGRLKTMIMDPEVATGRWGGFIEPVGEVPCRIYAHDSRLLAHRVAALDLSSVGWMRGPGVSSAVFTLETAMDDLAHAVGKDPLDIRILNHADVDPESGKPWTSKSLLRCYEVGAQEIGWRERPKGGSLREDGRIVGYGMATCFDAGRQFPASASLVLRTDGTALVSVAAPEIGQGITSALRTISAECLGLRRSDIELETMSPESAYGAGSIGSTGTFSNATAIYQAAERLKKTLKAIASKHHDSPLSGLRSDALTLQGGQVLGPEGVSVSVASVMEHHGRELVARGRTGATFGYWPSAGSKASFGAVFVEVSIDPLTYDLRVDRCIGAYGCGRIIEPWIARNQMLGGMIWGIGQALYEETRIDRRTGHWINANLAEALISTNADVREVRALFVEEDDTSSHPLGFKGLAELGVIGPAPAISNAILDATGHRMRHLPMLIEGRLPSMHDDALTTTR
ncbi:MAG: xanthine dehydrogenase family protein molybdopterin-binding subunit [Myxococcota bacterium]